MADDTLRFIQVGELVKGISEDTLPPDDALVGTSLVLHAEGGAVTRLTIAEAGRLEWEVIGGPGAGEHGEEACVVTRPRDEVVVIDYMASTRRATSVTIVLDLARNAATTVVGTLPTADQPRGAPSDSPLRAPSSRLSPRSSSPPPSIGRSWPASIPTSLRPNWSASGCSTCTARRRCTSTST